MNLLESIYYAFYLRRRRRFAAAPTNQGQKFGENFSGKIISVGNITTGGTGKTPAVQWLAHWLHEQGIPVAVVARGYGGGLSQAGAVVSDGRQILLDAAAAGDEPLLHARNLPGVPIVIGRDRVVAARRAVQELGAKIIILDDGFQYWSLRRDLDIVLLDARRPFDNGRLLPSGHLREPPNALGRADALLLTRSDLATPAQCDTARSRVRKFTDAPLFLASHAPVALRDESIGQKVEMSVLQDRPVCALSALADNAAFSATLREQGAKVVVHVKRRDHHRWRGPELRAVVQAAVAAGATAIVTTEKDAVKMQAQWVAPLPLWSLAIELNVANAQSLQNLIIDKVELF